MSSSSPRLPVLGPKCSQHSNTPWVRNALRLIQLWQGVSGYESHVATLEFMLSAQGDFCGIDNRVSLDAVVAHLARLGHRHSSSVPAFQNNVLVDLKREGAVTTLVYGRRGGGLFIPVDEAELRRATLHVLKRVARELELLSAMRAPAPIGDTVSPGLQALLDDANALLLVSANSQP